jgi:hypothetical protein
VRESRVSGQVEEEARRLVEAAGDWLRTHREQAERAQQEERAQQAERGAGQDHTTCQGCPWCRAKAAFGANGSETLESLADLLGSAADSLRLYAQSRRGPERSGSEESPAGESRAEESPGEDGGRP